MKNQRYYFADDDGDELVVDEDELLSLGLEIRGPRKPRKDKLRRSLFESAPGFIEARLVELGYDPKYIPKALRKVALDVAQCWDSGMCDDDDVAQATGHRTPSVRKAARALNVAVSSTSLSTPKPQPTTPRGEP